MKFCWTTLRVSDMQRSLAFYSEVLGLGPISRMGTPEHQVVMLGEDSQTKLELIWEDSPMPAHAGSGVSIGFAPENLDEMIAALREKHGIAAIGPISPSPDIRFFFIQDPDGYTVQLLAQAK